MQAEQKEKMIEIPEKEYFEMKEQIRLLQEKMQCQTLTVPEAAVMLGYTPDYLCWLMCEKKIDIGIVTQRYKGGKRDYKVARPKLNKLLGLS